MGVAHHKVAHADGGVGVTEDGSAVALTGVALVGLHPAVVLVAGQGGAEDGVHAHHVAGGLIDVARGNVLTACEEHVLGVGGVKGLAVGALVAFIVLIGELRRPQHGDFLQRVVVGQGLEVLAVEFGGAVLVKVPRVLAAGAAAVDHFQHGPGLGLAVGAGDGDGPGGEDAAGEAEEYEQGEQQGQGAF